MKKIGLWVLSAALVFSIAGCGEKPDQARSAAQSAAASAAASSQKAVVTIYEPDEQGLYVIPRSVTVSASQGDLMKAAVTQMIALDQKQKYPMLPKGLSVHSVTVSDGTASVDFSKELQNLRGGSTSEDLLIAMTANTLTSFPNVRQVRFLIDGQPIKKLTGHHDMTAAFPRDENSIKK